MEAISIENISTLRNVLTEWRTLLRMRVKVNEHQEEAAEVKYKKFLHSEHSGNFQQV